jgi:hypothetical protein
MWEFGLDEPQISALSEIGEGKMFEEWVEEALASAAGQSGPPPTRQIAL